MIVAIALFSYGLIGVAGMLSAFVHIPWFTAVSLWVGILLPVAYVVFTTVASALSTPLE